MNKNIVFAVIFLVFLSTCLPSALTYASLNKAPDNYYESVVETSNTIWVPDNYTTIQEAINNAKEGETIFVRTGTYYEHVVVDKPLSLIGENKYDTVVDANGTRIVVHVIAEYVNLSNFTIQNGEAGIWFWRSSHNVVTDNVILNNQYGVYVWGSKNNSFTGNRVTNSSQYGIYVVDSDSNFFSGNNASNNHRGIYVADSYYNSFINNIFSSHKYDGIFLYHSDSNFLSGNNASNNHRGIYVADSDSNFLSGNNASNNYYGIYIWYSRDNIFTGNTVTNNQHGVYLKSSSDNMFFHNNFIRNTELQNSIDSVNSWDNGLEGNYWSDYPDTDANQNGIGDIPHPIGENSQDNYPLIAMFRQFNIATENKSYKINVVCNSTISDFRYGHDPNAETEVVSFKVSGTEGNGFCRICIPYALIESPHAATVDNDPPAYFKVVHVNGTHTWLYLVYGPSEHEITIVHMSPSEQLILFQWAVSGLAIIIVILFLISINYYRLFNKQKKAIAAYERELGRFPVSQKERARMRFIKDVIEREEKIEKFKKKYGIKIQPAGTLEDLMPKLGVQKED